jgi:hypothetical protein
MKRALFGLVPALGVAMICNAAPVAENQVKVAPEGVTDVIETYGNTRISVRISTHEVNIGKPSDPWPQRRLTSCTYSRFPCSLVDNIELAVDGRSLFVARSVFADLTDLNVAELRKEKDGIFVLVLRGGDASESFTAEVRFDKTFVRQRQVASNLDGQVSERTTYFASRGLD